MEILRWHKPGSQAFPKAPRKISDIHMANQGDGECLFGPLISRGLLLTSVPTTSCKHHRRGQEPGSPRPKHRGSCRPLPHRSLKNKSEVSPLGKHQAYEQGSPFWHLCSQQPTPAQKPSDSKVAVSIMTGLPMATEVVN